MIYYFQYEKDKMAVDCGTAISRMPDRLRQEFGRIKRVENRLEHLLAWTLLEEAVRRENGITSLEQLDISRTEKGKPYSRAYPELHFNLSHCESACACVLSDGQNGIDIERIFPYRHSLAKRVCHEEEWDYLNSLPEDGGERTEFLRVLWSVKESLVKYEGSGLGYGVERLNVMGLFDGKAQNPGVQADPFYWKSAQMFQQQLKMDGLELVEVQVLRGERFTLAACSREHDLKIEEIKTLPGFEMTDGAFHSVI